MDSTEVSILKQTNEVCLRGLLESQNSLRLETKVSLEVLGDLANETLERKFTYQ
jgi:hypothetical protein